MARPRLKVTRAWWPWRVLALATGLVGQALMLWVGFSFGFVFVYAIDQNTPAALAYWDIFFSAWLGMALGGQAPALLAQALSLRWPRVAAAVLGVLWLCVVLLAALTGVVFPDAVGSALLAAVLTAPLALSAYLHFVVWQVERRKPGE